MAMRQIDMIGIVGKTQDAAQAQTANVRGHATMQDQIAGQQAARAERASEQVSATAPEDKLELTNEGGGNGSGGTAEGFSEQEEEENGAESRPAEEERHIDFLA